GEVIGEPALEDTRALADVFPRIRGQALLEERFDLLGVEPFKPVEVRDGEALRDAARDGIEGDEYAGKSVGDAGDDRLGTEAQEGVRRHDRLELHERKVRRVERRDSRDGAELQIFLVLGEEKRRVLYAEPLVHVAVQRRESCV